MIYLTVEKIPISYLDKVGIFYLAKKINYMKKIFNLREEIIPLSRRQNIALVVAVACIFQFALFFSPVLAAEAVLKTQLQDEEINDDLVFSPSLQKSESADQEVLTSSEETGFPDHVSKIEIYSDKKYTVISVGTHAMTAYNSEVGQTDDTPCITANGFNVCEHGIEDTVAANFLKFGTKVRIPELFGDRVFTVRDRMNKRYTDRVDVWMINKKDALQFGIRTARIEVLEEIK